MLFNITFVPIFTFLFQRYHISNGMTIVEMYKKVLVLSDKDVESYVHMMINKEGIILDYLKHYAEHYYVYAKSLYCSWWKW